MPEAWAGPGAVLGAAWWRLTVGGGRGEPHCGRRRGGLYLLKWEQRLIKVRVSRSKYVVGHWIIAPITFGVGRITEKDARN